MLQVRAADIERLVEATPDPAAYTLGASAASALQGECVNDATHAGTAARDLSLSLCA